MRRLGACAILLCLAVAGCGHTTINRPDPSIEFEPTQPVFHADQDIVAVLKNHSTLTLMVAGRVCPGPVIERSDGGSWTAVPIHYVVACPLDVPAPLEFPPGATATYKLARATYQDDLAPGTYRLAAWVSNRIHPSQPFTVVAR